MLDDICNWNDKVKMRCAVHVARIREKGDTYKVLAGKLKRKRPLRRPTQIREDNIVTDLLKALLGNGSVNTFQRATMETVSQ
jgi:hypothetical protein